MFNQEKASASTKPIKPNGITAVKVLIAFAVMFVPVIAMKAYHMLKFTDPATGFFYNRTDITVYIYYAITVAAVLILCALSYFSARGGNLPKGKVFRRRSVVTGVLALGAAACLGYRAYEVYVELSLVAANNQLTLLNASRSTGYNVFFLGQLIFGALGALWLLLYAVARISGKNFCKKLGILSLAPAVWGACRVIEYFTVTISYLNVAELFCDIFSAVLIMVFLFCLARCAVDIEGDNAVWTVFASGLSAALITLSTQLIRIFLMVSGRDEMLVTNRPFSILYFVFGIFALSEVMFAALHKKKKVTADAGEWEVADIGTASELSAQTPEISLNTTEVNAQVPEESTQIPEEDAQAPDGTTDASAETTEPREE